MQAVYNGKNNNLFLADFLENQIDKDHPYRKVLSLLDFQLLLSNYHELYSKRGAPGIPLIKGFKALLLQHWKNISDRQMEDYLRDSFSAKFFCDFALDETTPDHSYFCKLRKRIGLGKLTEIFNDIVKILNDKGYLGETFYFLDASALRARVNIWEARDKALEDKNNTEKDDDDNPKMNNKNVSKYSTDKDAKFGAKGKNNFWFGYKLHVLMDFKFGFITKNTVTSAEVPDYKALLTENLLPSQGMVFADKGYDYKDVHDALRHKGCGNAVIRKKTSQDKNRELDKWRSSIRMPGEGVFSQMPKKTRFIGQVKVEFGAMMQSMVYNLKLLSRIGQIVPSLA